MTQYGPSAFRRAMQARAGREQQARQHAVWRLLAALKRVDAATRHVKSGNKLIRADLWRELLAAAEALRGQR
jgi:hypothetical protein